MSDYGSNEKKGFAAFTNSPFFTFSRPYLNFIGKGTMFSIVYYLMAVVSLVFPFYAIYWAVSNRIFTNWGGDIIPQILIWFILTWFFIAFAGWIGFQLWWDRKSQVSNVKNSEFVATPICADIIRTFGEWLGTILAIVGFGGGLFGLIIMNQYMHHVIPFGFGSLLIITGPITGFFIILIFRLMAEGIRIFVSIAHSLRFISQKMAVNK